MQQPSLDSIAVSVFVDILIEFDKYSIRRQRPNNNSDTVRQGALSSHGLLMSDDVFEGPSLVGQYDKFYILLCHQF